MSFVGFAPNELDSFIVRKYKANDSFNILIDTVGYNSTLIGPYLIVNYTISPFYQGGNPRIATYINQIQAGFDWQIYIPSTTKTISISNIIDEKKSVKDHGYFPGIDNSMQLCQNPIVSLTVDSTNLIFSDTTTNFQIFIRR